MANIGLFIGRFQPFHKGHLAVVQGMMKVCDKVIMGMGSSQFSRTEFNPFTADERRQMIGMAVEEAGIDLERFVLLELPDMPSDEGWVDHVFRITGSVTKVWSGNEHTRKLFEAGNMPVQNISPVPGISATAIRESVAKGDGEWHKQVPKEVKDWIIQNGGQDIIKQSRDKSDPAERPEMWRVG
ncbi:MAG: nicotinamide-nucleotide adenylyltransferase [Patescibacteria group bacterium]